MALLHPFDFYFLELVDALSSGYPGAHMGLQHSWVIGPRKLTANLTKYCPVDFLFITSMFTYVICMFSGNSCIYAVHFVYRNITIGTASQNNVCVSFAFAGLLFIQHSVLIIKLFSDQKLSFRNPPICKFLIHIRQHILLYHTGTFDKRKLLIGILQPATV